MTTKEKLLSLAKNSIVLDIAGEAEYVPGGTRFGGKPDVPEDFQWPYFGEGPDEDDLLPLAFLAQFDCAELSAMDDEGLLPDHGLLSLFYDMNAYGYQPEDRGSARVYWFEEPEGLAPTDFPEDLEEEYRFPMVCIDMQAEASYPRQEEFEEMFPEETDWKKFYTAESELDIEIPDARSKLLGWPDTVQHAMYRECDLVTRGYFRGPKGYCKATPQGDEKISPEELAKADRAIDRWQLLIQLGPIFGDGFEFMVGDCGLVYVFIKKDELAERKFQNIWAIMQDA